MMLLRAFHKKNKTQHQWHQDSQDSNLFAIRLQVGWVKLKAEEEKEGEQMLKNSNTFHHFADVIW